MEDDPDPVNTIDKCSVIYDDTFHGQWEDGTLYNEAESGDFWAPNEPSELRKETCNGVIFDADEQSQAYCERGPNGKPDRRRHCTQIIPADVKQIKGDEMKPNAGKWIVYWCWMKVRGYICERPANGIDGPEDGTASTFTTVGVETQTSATPKSCGTRLDECTKRARRRADEIVREINDTRIGYSVVIEAMALGSRATYGPRLRRSKHGSI
ncbi:hypothetical protein AAVH_21998 [Aphelenchoides avenae]|nr:hypothetical protein AAVH_21998 [Aphelenchus avenae]